MKHYKDENNKVWAYPLDGSQDHLIPSHFTLIKSDDELRQLKDKTAEDNFNELDWYRKRIFSYPEIGLFLDAWVKNDQVALEEYRQKCLEIKAKFPKPPGF
jgi:hypothetical protein